MNTLKIVDYLKLPKTSSSSSSNNRFLSNPTLHDADSMLLSSTATADHHKAQKISVNKYKAILDELRVELTEQIKNYNQIVIDYEDTVSYECYNKLLKKYKKLEQVYENVSEKKNELQKSFYKLVEMNAHVKAQHEKLVEQQHILRHSSTPRPDWSRCATVVDAWSRIANVENKSSDELVDVLLNELLGRDTVVSKQRYFEVFDEETRSTRHVYNRCFNRRELALLISELWRAKVNHDLERRLNGDTRRMKMSDFVGFYFNKRFHAAHEWVVNLKEACKRFKNYSDAQFMLQVLNNEIDEDIHHAFFDSVGRLYLKLEQNEPLEKSLTEIFAQKTTKQINELLKAAGENTTNDYKHLFRHFDDGRLCSKFLAVLKAQFETERIESVRKIARKLEHLEYVNRDDFLKCTPNENSCEEWIFKQNECIEKQEFLKRLQSVNLIFIGLS